MSHSNNSPAASAQALLDALIELRRLGQIGDLKDAKRFRSAMLDLHPEMKKEVRVLSSLFDAGFGQRLQECDAGERHIVAGQIRLWLEEELMLRADIAQLFGNVLLAFFNGETKAAAVGSASVSGAFGSGLQMNVAAASNSGSAVGAFQNAPSPAASCPPQSVSKPAGISPQSVYANKQVGERFEFGRYPQGANGEIKPIIWRVLRRDADGLLVVAEQGLDCKKYHDKWVLFSSVTWEKCTLRRWLNSDFINRAFSEKECGLILAVSVSNNAGSSTVDRVFLLSKDEANKLFAGNKDRRCKPTVYAVKEGAYLDSNGNCLWWLRSRPGSLHDTDATCVRSDGDIPNYVVASLFGGYDVGSGEIAVRPALKLAL